MYTARPADGASEPSGGWGRGRYDGTVILPEPLDARESPDLPDLTTGLRQLGFEAFRPGQREAIESLLIERRLLLVAPTGGGKSLVYQLPACLLPGTTLVISPLIALMHDQVAALEARGVAATYLASTLKGRELSERLFDLARGKYKLAYVAPERLSHRGFRGLLHDLDCPLIAIDEAHCISEWGHDFRPDYMGIGEVLAALPGARTLACTATATPVVRDEILARLGLSPDTRQIVRGFARPNLRLRAAEVQSAVERRRRVDALLAEALGEPGAARGAAIVYATTRRASEQEADRLAAQGWRTACYHAGRPADERARTSDGFVSGKFEIVAATNAFGMGIDRPDVRAVMHLAPPGSIEAYYQEVGRAGRDGEPAWGLVLTSSQDLPRRRRLIEWAGDDRPPPDPTVVEHKWNLFLELMRWIEGGSCRHDAILRYFAAETEELHGCGHCDVCTTFTDEPADPEAVSLIVRKALSGVARIHQRFGLTLAGKLLVGKPDERLGWSQLDQVKTYGALKEKKEEWIMRLLRRCVTAGWIMFTPGERPLAMLTDEGAAVMRGERPARLLLPPERTAAAQTGRSSRGRTAAVVEELDEASREIFEELRQFRLARARAEDVPPYVVASDRTLRDIARLKPKNRAELLLAHGIGPSKAERYGDDLLKVVARTSDGEDGDLLAGRA